MQYLSVCSGIEAASVAWHGLGWQPVGLSEIDPFPTAVLSHRFPDVPNLGDMNDYRSWPDERPDILVGGTPCQSFSVAGLRKGLDDPRGNLALVYLGLVDRFRPQWVVLENVPGVLSSSGGRDFGAFVGGLAKLGYGVAWRVLDAQYVRTCGHPRAVPQRRRRVFVVGHPDPRRARAVLFDAESLRGHPPPCRQAGQGAAPTLASRTRGGGGLGTDFDCDDGLIAAPAVSLCLNAGGMGRIDAESETLLPISGGVFDDGPICFDSKGTQVQNSMAGATPTLRAMGHASSHQNGGGHLAVAFDTTQITSPGNVSSPRPGDPCHPLTSAGDPPAIATPWAVRRLAPVECERLQGFPDDWTLIPWRKGMAPDGLRYKALGNSMAVNVMRWIGDRIALVESIR